MYYTIMKTQMCDIILVGDDKGLAHLHLDTQKGKRKFEIKEEWIQNDDFFKEIELQLTDYFRGNLMEFNIKLNPSGTDYQKKIWSELRNIPYNQLLTYKDVAIKSGNPNASRAVGMANSKNPIPIIVPCHRVVGSNGKLTGFAHGLEVKEKLIHLEKLTEIYQKLRTYYGDLNWWPSETDYEMMLGAILTQNTSWTNVEKAIKNLGEHLNPKSILEMTIEQLGNLIKPSGYYNQKAIKIKALTRWLENYNFDLEVIKQKNGESLRKELLSIYGVGRETADSILTYSLDKPFFIIDTYTKRLFSRLGFHIPEDYDEFRIMLESLIEKDLDKYNKYHALIVEHCKEFCTKSPKCNNCPLAQSCKFFLQQ